MFFFLSKIVVVFLSPLVWSCLLIFCGILLRKQQVSKKLVWVGLIILLLFSNAVLFQLVVAKWKYSEKKVNKINDFPTTAVVLGGFAEWDSSKEKLVFTEASARVLYAMELMQTTGIEKLIISGGNGSLYSEARQVKEFAMRIGFQDSTIIAENNSRNTYENAHFTSDLFAQHFWQKK